MLFFDEHPKLLDRIRGGADNIDDQIFHMVDNPSNDDERARRLRRRNRDDRDPGSGAAAAAVPMIHIILSNVAMLLFGLAVKSVELAVAVVTVRLVVLLVVLQRSDSSRVSSTEFILSSDITESDRGIYVGVHIRRVFYLFEIHVRFHASLFVHGSLTTFKILSTYALFIWQEFRVKAANGVIIQLLFLQGKFSYWLTTLLESE